MWSDDDRRGAAYGRLVIDEGHKVIGSQAGSLIISKRFDIPLSRYHGITAADSLLTFNGRICIDRENIDDALRESAH